MEMAACYRDLGNNAMVARCLEPMLVESGAPPEIKKRILPPMACLILLKTNCWAIRL
jgi:hypothetical protein